MQAQAPADQALLEKLATAEATIRVLQTQAYNLSQLTVTQQSNQHLQQIVALKSGMATETMTLGSLPVGGNAGSTASPVFTGGRINLGTFALPTPPVGVPGAMGCQVLPVSPPGTPGHDNWIEQLGIDHLHHYPESWGHGRWLPRPWASSAVG